MNNLNNLNNLNYLDSEKNIKILENRVNFLENKISKLEKFITLNIEKKYNNNNIFFDDINNINNINDINNITNKEVKIPYLKRMNAFNLSE